MIWLKERIYSWMEAMTVNDVNSLKSVMPSLSVGNFFACSKTVLQLVMVTDLESMAYNALEFLTARFSLQAVNASTILTEYID